LKDKAYHDLKRLILTGALEPHATLSERHLVSQFQMSRTPIRDAIQRLVIEGLLAYAPNKGVTVADLSLQQAVDLYDLRVALETHIVRELCHGTTPVDASAALKTNLVEQHQFMEARDHVRFTEKDSEFHRLLAAAHGNQEIIRIMDRAQDQILRTAIRVLKKDHERIVVSYEDHQRIFAAVIAQDDQQAEHLVREHLEFGKRILIS
jgi:DNA-binding GntR family transcriptional regulator